MLVETPRLVIAGTGSGSGKTTLTCALLAAFARRGLNPAAFKCGPDYIDPMFHETALGIPSRNLDIFLCGEETVCRLLAKNSHGHGIALIEGVMGLYDGILRGGREQAAGSASATAAETSPHGRADCCSTNHIATLTRSPTLLTVTTRGLGLSLAALVQGYLRFLPNTLQGVVLNQCSPAMYPVYKRMLEEKLGLPVYGSLPALPQSRIESRHLGLVTPGEIRDIREKLAELARVCEESLDLEGLLALGRSAAPLESAATPARPPLGVRLAVARDAAFCFVYQDSLDLLHSLGAELVFFSPLRDAGLPPGCHGLILGGGYPELYARDLAENRPMLDSLRAAARAGLPILAECGGYMYLCRELRDAEGETHTLAGIIDASTCMTASLKRFGYVRLTANRDTWLCSKGTTIPAHEFHYSESSDAGAAFTAAKASGSSWPCIHSRERLFAGYPHLHLCGCPELAENYLAACLRFKQEHPQRKS